MTDSPRIPIELLASLGAHLWEQPVLVQTDDFQGKRHSWTGVLRSVEVEGDQWEILFADHTVISIPKIPFYTTLISLK